MTKYFRFSFTYRFIIIALSLWIWSGTLTAQEATWLNTGSLHNWYSAIGNEREHGIFMSQQYGLRWPAIVEFQDAQCSKAFWIGAKKFDDGVLAPFQPKVIHSGPRVLGGDHFFPIEFTLFSRFEAPEVLVDGNPTFLEEAIPDTINPGLPSDRMLRNTVETAMGLTFTREIHQFSQQHHDNYHIFDYTFTNETGQYREIPEQTLEDLYFYYQFRYAPVRKSRYMIANHTGWGRNTMNDRWGDGLRGQDIGEPFSPGGPPMRAAYAWHGYDPSRRVDYNNIGAPQIDPVGTFMSLSDTLGHLLAHHFVGHATIHADTSPSDSTDNLLQPTTRGHINSDDHLMIGNDPFNRERMQSEYNLISKGVMNRHAYTVHSADAFMDFADQRNDPRFGTSGGMSSMKAYGPYTLAPGESVRIVWVEGVSGLSMESARKIGERYKAYVEGRTSEAVGPRIDGTDGVIDDRAKNEWVLTGRDSLLHTFERAIRNYQNDFDIPQPPEPPSVFEVISGDGNISLEWAYSGDLSRVEQFEIWRTEHHFDQIYDKIHVANTEERSFVDENVERGIDYYYYITAVGPEKVADNATKTPAGSLSSSRYYTQTYDPAKGGATFAESGQLPYFELHQNYPNPFNPSTRITYSVPVTSRVRLDVYDVLGQRIATLVDGKKSQGLHTAIFDAEGLASGVYLYRLKAGDHIQTKQMVLSR